MEEHKERILALIKKELDKEKFFINISIIDCESVMISSFNEDLSPIEQVNKRVG